MSMAGNRARWITELALPLIGPVIWSAHLFVLYGAEALLCSAPEPSQPILSFVATAATAVAVILLLGLMLWQLQREVRHVPTGPFLREVSIVLAGLALLGVLWTALPATLVSACRSGQEPGVRLGVPYSIGCEGA